MESGAQKKGIYKFLDWVEKVGNKLPSPFMLFVILMVFTMVLSMVLSWAGLSVTYYTGVGGELTQTTVTVQNLLSREVLTDIISRFTSIYVGFAPLGLVLVMMMGIGLVEHTGLISALMRKTLLGAPPALVTIVLAFVGVNANLASDAGMIFAAAMGGALYKALGRNPKLGIVVGFAASSGGFTANILIAGTDGLLAGITQTVAEGSGIVFNVNPAMNWYFMLVATFVVTGVTAFIAEKVTAKSLAHEVIEVDETELKKHELTPEENRGLRAAGIALLVYVALLLVALVPEDGFLRGPDGGVLQSPFMSGIVAIIFFFFVSTGIAYGIAAGAIKGEGDIARFMQKSVTGAAPFLVVALAASMFIQMFNASGLTAIIAVNGAEFIGGLGIGIIPLSISFILLTAFINLFTISGSAKWLILAPVFVPMFAMMGISPAFTQVAYRIGDSATNIISPLSPLLPVIIGIFDQYKRKEDPPAGFGTVISYALPYSIAYMVTLTLLLIAFILLGLDVGPGAPIFF